MKDMTGEKCLACGLGVYRETSVHDDWEGVLHCIKCKHETKRYVAAEPTKEQNHG